MLIMCTIIIIIIDREILFSVVFGLFIVIVSVETEQTTITISNISRRNSDDRRSWRNSFLKHRNRLNSSRQGRAPFRPHISLLFKHRTTMLPRCPRLPRSVLFRKRIPSIPTVSRASPLRLHRSTLSHSNVPSKISPRTHRHLADRC